MTISGDRVMAKTLVNTFLILLFVLSFPFNSFSEEIYEFERMWPVLEQPWYFNDPRGIAIDSSGYVYVADKDNHRIQKFTSNGQFVTKWGGWGNEDGQFNEPIDIAIDRSGYFYVLERGNARIQKFTSNGQFVTKWGGWGSGDGQFKGPYGIAVDKDNYVYVADTENARIQKFTSDGQFVTKWGSSGSGDGQFNWPEGIAVDSSGNVYIVDAGNCRIQKFTSKGKFIAKWGSEGNGDSQFNSPYGIAIDRSGDIYVTDYVWVKKFTSKGQFIVKWGRDWGRENGEFIDPRGIAIDSSGNVYVADAGNARIQKLTANGQFIAKWGSGGEGDGQFYEPSGIAIDSGGNIYVSEFYNNRIQKFTSNGLFIAKWGEGGEGDGQFYGPSGIAIDSGGNIYVSEFYNNRIQKFTSNGLFIAKWGSHGTGDGQFNSPRGIAVDVSGNVYVVEAEYQGSHRIQKFTSDGQFVTKWGSEGEGNGEFNYPEGIAVDSSGNVYVADQYNNRIQKFTSDGQFITEWGSWGSGDGQFIWPSDIAIDSSGYIYIVDLGDARIQKFTSDGQFVTKWGSFGSNPGEFSYPEGIAVSSEGRVYVSDTGNNRIQVFKPASYVPSNKVIKAIVVAGSGPYKGNNLWDATEMNANYAYRVLAFQGYTSDTIYYLSSDRNLDLNGDGIPDVDGDATNSNLQNAITQWAKDAESLVVYLTGHGGDGTFEMSETEILRAEDLASWLNELQGTMEGLVTILYDACESGSFVSKLAPPSGKQRILITSTSPGEPAYFLSQGALSFSYPFWSQIFGGAKIYDAYVMAKDVVGVAIGAGKSQNPEIDDNGNGIGNEKTDGDLARDKYIGKGIVTAGSIPRISTISPDQVLSGQTSATIAVEVVSTGRITRVWAVVYSPDFSTTPGSPVTDLPSFDLAWNEQSRRYEGTYNGFTVMGTYTIAVYAMNENMIISLPKATKVEQTLYTQYTLTVVKSGAGSGTVTSSPAGITCGDDCSETYLEVQKVKLTAKADVSSTFTGWSGGGCSGTKTCTVTVDTSVAVTADFALKTPDISVDQASINFGEINVKKKATKTLKITNNGTGDLVITLSGLEGTDFSIQGSSSFTIKAKKSYSLKVLFTPGSTGLETATLTITSNDPDTPTIDVSLSGTGQ